MKKTITSKTNKKAPATRGQVPTMAIDLGDKTSRYCAIDQEGAKAEEGSFATTEKGVKQVFGARPRCLVAMEVGTHSRWVSRLLKELGFQVIVANARQLKLISASSRKDDRTDAETLARMARADPALLRPIRHRGEAAQADLNKIRVRAGFIKARTALINEMRGLAKAEGQRLAACDPDAMTQRLLDELPAYLREALKRIMESVEHLTAQIKACNKELEQIATEKYPETRRLTQVSGVGPLIALTFVLTIDDPTRFRKSRDVGCYAGLRPRRSASGERQPELSITKEGDRYLRTMLVQGAHYILGHRGPDTDLKRFGMKIANGGKKNAKKRAIVAVARKLSVLLHRLWVSGEVYEPLRNSKLNQAAA